ncbi:hypothetical protein RH858_08090 [Halalkaliarchaeum sp. AArc-GB]|uniref:hypothetical protein n=1 Tax=Halalkaliarchaeum sp. AArc-GB TaxID=3074078 RepID=UPI002862C665|nr:hypothetical protein [Halalkaliarchaeum sp. AArc-GB]MDR5673108.1 hypothetical protein [Halalkaliarchaeum sp. AArc-GB]
MSSRFFVLASGLAVALFVVTASGGLVGAAAAADAPANETVNESVAETILDESEADTLEHQEEIRLSDAVTIVGWEFENSQLRLGIEAERTTHVQIADGVAGMGEAGATRIPRIEERVFGDRTTVIVMPVEEFAGGHAVGVGAGGSSIRLSTEMDESGDDPFRHFGGESGLFSGMLLAIFASLGGAGYVLWKEDSGVMKA